MRINKARRIIKGRIESRRQVRYYANISKVILIQTRIRMFLAKRRLSILKHAEHDAAAFMIQRWFRAQRASIIKKRKSLKLITQFLIFCYLRNQYAKNWTYPTFSQLNSLHHQQLLFSFHNNIQTKLNSILKIQQHNYTFYANGRT